MIVASNLGTTLTPSILRCSLRSSSGWPLLGYATRIVTNTPADPDYFSAEEEQ